MGGLIPAYAGRTLKATSRRRMDWAHPRLRGADAIRLKILCLRLGSSPLTRGGQDLGFCMVYRRGLIPAYAGRTQTVVSSLPTFEAHPRLRGADLNCPPLAPCRHGSSPLTRGGLCPLGLVSVYMGLIPAYAGRTVVLSLVFDSGRAHPRLRGADHRMPKRFINIFRLIPAYAGRTRHRPTCLAPSGAHPRLRGADSSRTKK